MSCGYRNVAIGFQTGYQLTSGNNNTIVGYCSFITSTVGAANTIIGSNNLTGAYNPTYMIALGTNIQQNGNYSCSAAIGKDVMISASNYLFLGSTGALLGQKVTASCTSSKYWKVYINGVLECVLLI